jgi:hypothetical protein
MAVVGEGSGGWPGVAGVVADCSRSLAAGAWVVVWFATAVALLVAGVVDVVYITGRVIYRTEGI